MAMMTVIKKPSEAPQMIFDADELPSSASKTRPRRGRTRHEAIPNQKTIRGAAGPDMKRFPIKKPSEASQKVFDADELPSSASKTQRFGWFVVWGLLHVGY